MRGKKDILEAYSSVLGQLNDETQQHSKRVALLCGYFAEKLGLDSVIAYKIGLLHDVGKMYIPSRILKKNCGLTPLERDIIDSHAYVGYRILKEMGEPPIIYMPTLFHHGFWKIKFTYPSEPLTSEMIKYVYLIHSTDILDAVTNRRKYHEPASKDTVLKILDEDVMCTDELRQLIAEADTDAIVSEPA